MKMIVISSAPLVSEQNLLFGYSPYIREMEIWAQYCDEIGFLCPVLESGEGQLLMPLNFTVAKLFRVKSFDAKSIGGIFRAVFFSFYNFWTIYKAMRWADHIHLRCPGNISLMGCMVQILFPHKKKTAKYAGNWDPNASQPLSYKIQRWLLANTLLTRNMQVLVYGEWPNSTHNIKPFFTATYRESQKEPVAPRALTGPIKFLFVGTLSEGKRPLYAVQIVEALQRLGHNVSIDFYGEGKVRESLENYITANKSDAFVTLKGNRDADEILSAYKNSHFLLLPSKSEGWPKVVAEAMFWGCCPLATGVSCVPYMLDGGRRGLVLNANLENDVAQIATLLDNQQDYNAKVAESVGWSRQFTLDLFAKEIKALLQ
jgi:glycosyltransferase involved in cell wall biosynthesis